MIISKTHYRKTIKNEFKKKQQTKDFTSSSGPNGRLINFYKQTQRRKKKSWEPFDVGWCLISFIRAESNVSTLKPSEGDNANRRDGGVMTRTVDSWLWGSWSETETSTSTRDLNTEQDSGLCLILKALYWSGNLEIFFFSRLFWTKFWNLSLKKF